jgi:glutamate N-acetyltransferase / amino-acid N-acetyltransferase
MPQTELAPVRGFRFSGVAAGIKKTGALDVGLAVADGPAVAAGVFTRNVVRAAPVLVAESRLASGTARAILANSGCANACTGQPGLDAALATTQALAAALAVETDAVLPASTGVIGRLLPAERISAHAGELVRRLSPEGFAEFAEAIRTTDRWPKLARRAVGGSSASLLGIAKGAGMIHPDMGPPQATMLAFLFTDLIVDRAVLEVALREAVDATFNACSVDGDTSTNDCVIAMASGASGERAGPELGAALRDVCSELARSIVADGEGSEHMAEIRVSGLASEAEARAVARTIATSLLVKTALFGKDANWGRLLAAAGRAGVQFDPSRAVIRIGGIEVARGGLAVGEEAERRAAEALAGASYAIELELGDGPAAFGYLTSDLGHGYVDVNAGYRS